MRNLPMLVVLSAIVVVGWSGVAGCGGGGGTDGDTQPDGDTAADGDTAIDGDTAVDGDTTADGDTAADGDTPTDGDTQTDGDTTADGDTTPDGDIEIPTECVATCMLMDNCGFLTAGGAFGANQAECELACVQMVAGMSPAEIDALKACVGAATTPALNCPALLACMPAQPDGDIPVDGDTPVDGDVPVDGDAPPDGDIEIPTECIATCMLMDNCGFLTAGGPFGASQAECELACVQMVAGLSEAEIDALKACVTAATSPSLDCQALLACMPVQPDGDEPVDGDGPADGDAPADGDTAVDGDAVSDLVCAGGICTDPATGFEWQQEPTGGIMNWNAATTHCQNLDLSGTGWRLPTISELRALIQGCEGTGTGGGCGVTDSCRSQSPPCLTDDCNGCSDGGGPAAGCYWPELLNGECGWYWSVSEEADSPNYVWRVDFYRGEVWNQRISDPLNVRCAR